MKKVSYLTAVTFVMLTLAGCLRNNPVVVETIDISINKSVASINLLDFETISKPRIIPLQTKDCLIGEITSLKVYDDAILIVDEMSESVLVFDINGSLKVKINRCGRAEQEYLSIADAEIYNNQIVVYDYISQRLLCYDISSGEYISTLRTKAIWADKMFNIDNTLFFVNNKSTAEMGNYCLYAMANLGEFTPYIPFYNEYGWTLDNYSTTADDIALLHFPPYDTIYMASALENPQVKYFVNFGKDKIDMSILEADPYDAIKYATKSTQTLGIDKVAILGKHIVISFSNNERNYHAVYNTTSHNVEDVASKLFIGDIQLNHNWRTQNDKLFYHMSALDFVRTYEAFDSYPSFQQVAQNINELDNPVIVLFNVKEK